MPTQLLAKTALAAFLTLGFAACGGDSGASDPAAMTDAGYSKLDAQDYEGAQVDFQAAIDGGAKDASLKEATLGLVEALAHLDAAKARDAFLAFAGEHADQLVSKDFSKIGGTLMSAGGTAEAVAVVDAGLQRFADDANLKKVLDAIMAKAAAGDAAAASALSGLGYL
jgi:hypothetical protein